MKKFRIKYLPLILLIAISSGIIYHNFSKVLACPECYLYEDAGDGLKNYYTFSWYVLKDKGTHFSGMNYPYGEHIFFTDNHPGLAMIFNFLHRYIVDLDGHTVGIINILLIISLFLSCLILFNIFRILRVGRYTSVAFALVITFLSPQIARFTGHYSLGHVIFIPLFLLILLKYHSSDRKWKWATLAILWVTFAGFTHLYYFLMMTAFIAFYMIITLVKTKGWRAYRINRPKFLISISQIVSMLVIPAIVLLTFLKLTDTIHDRPTSPWRGIGLNAKFHGTFVPNYGPFPEYWKELFGTTPPDAEAMSYVGIVGFFMIPFAFFFLLRNNRKNKNHKLSSNSMHTFLFSSLGVWIIAAGILYSPIFSWLLELVPKLKQFRGMGRLAWVFYYVYTIFIGYYLYRFDRYLSMKGIKIAGKSIIIISLLLFGFEAYLLNRPILGSILKSNQYLSKKDHTFSDFLQKNGFQTSDFQAVLQLPLINLGGETSGVSRGNWTMRKGVQSAFDTRLPLIDWSLSRTSAAQSADFLQLLSSSAIEKKRTLQMNRKPLLVICEKNLITEAERRLIDQATFIDQVETIRIYKMEMSAFDQKLSEWRTQLDSSKMLSPPIIEHNFEDEPHPAAIIGSGVKRVAQKREKVFEYESTLDSTTNAILHLWVMIDQHEAGMSVLRIKETAPDNRVVYDQGIHRRDVDWSEVYGQWMRLDRQLQIKEKGYRYEFFIDEKGSIIDGLQIRKQGYKTVVRYPEAGISFLNGTPIPQ